MSIVLVFVVVPVVTGVVVALLSNISGHGSDDSTSSGLQFGFMIEESFMKLGDGGRDVTAFQLINDRFVVIRQTFE